MSPEVAAVIRGDARWHVEQGDCLDVMGRIPSETVPLVYADPPFNVGMDYADHDDRQPRDEYLNGLQTRLAESARLLTPDGSLWVSLPDEVVAHVAVRLDRLLTRRNWIVWHYRFGPHQRRKFGRDKTHLLYYVVDPKRFTFDGDAIRVPSARQAVYRDKRANPAGRVPGDVWEIPRVCGTFRARKPGHPCQQPAALVERVIRACSRPGDVVLDPYCGAGTTLAAAVRLGRRALGIELSASYAAMAREALEGEGVAR